MSAYNGRTTSYAKTIDPEYERMVAERNLRLTKHYEQAQTLQRPAERPEQSKPQERTHAAAPAMHLRPGRWQQRTVDRPLFREQQGRLDEAVRARNKALMERQQQAREHDRDQERNRSR